MDLDARSLVTRPPTDEPGRHAWRVAHGPDLTVVAIWVATRVAVFAAATYATWVFAGEPSVFSGDPAQTIPPQGPIATWDRWDVEWYRSIVFEGYGAPGHESNYAFPPGLPALMWGLGRLNVHLTLAGLLISFVAGLMAALALARLTAGAGGRPEWGVLAWVLAPVAVFLAAPYSESLFCALAFPAWLMARRGSWLAAALLASGACLVRVNGVFLVAGLVVLFATSPSRAWRRVPLLVLPSLAVLGVLTYFYTRTGQWSTWLDAESAGWGRHFNPPWTTVSNTVHLAFDARLTATYAVQYRAELLVAAVILALSVVMLVKRWWGEATYVLLTLAALGTSTQLYAVPRTTLVLFPIWVLLGLWMTRSRVLLVSYSALAAPLMLVAVIGFTQGRWIA